MELFKTRAGLNIMHLPYQGFPQVMNAILAGEVQAAFMVPGIATGSLPGYPSFVEQGYADFEAVSWQAVLALAKTPKPIIDRVSSELIRIIRSDEVRARMLGAAGTAREALARLMATERENWCRVITAANVRAE